MKRLSRPIYRRPPETIVALVDVVFFLLVFALLIGRMDATAPFRVDPPAATSGVNLPSGGRTISLGENGALALDGETLSRDSLYHEIQLLMTSAPETQIRINADGATALRHLLPLVEEIKGFGATDVILIVTPDAG